MSLRPSGETVARMEIVAAWVFLIGSIINWPLSQLTYAKDEYPVTLGLSWLAIILTAVDYLKNSRIHKESQEAP